MNPATPRAEDQPDGKPGAVKRVPSGVETNAPAPTQVVVYWRPGCGFCSSLRRRLHRAGLVVTEINIYDDADATRLVRSVAHGNETVPTVVIGTRALVNPRLEDVLAVVRADAPHLLPAVGTDPILRARGSGSGPRRWRLFGRSR
ncbi:MAG: mycoredoxin [Acidimicrobiales bacterium]